jgi:hypothetical protein
VAGAAGDRGAGAGGLALGQPADQDIKERYGKRGDLERVAPGQFQESASGNRVFFLDKDTPDNKSGKNIFISTTEKGKETVTSARSGRIVAQGEDQFLQLNDGQRLESSLTQPGLKVSEFGEFGTRVGSSALSPAGQAARQGAVDLDAADRPQRAQSRRAGLAAGPGAGGAEFRGDGGGRVQRQSARRPQRQPGVRPVRLRRLLQPPEPGPELDRGRPHQLPGLHAGACMAAHWWPACSGWPSSTTAGPCGCAGGGPHRLPGHAA